MDNYTTQKKENGEVVFKGKKYALIQSAYVDNYGMDGGVRYYAHAIDKIGKKYKVAWDTTAEWNKHQGGHEEQDASGYKVIGPVAHPDKMTCGFCEDESNACDWDNPISVESVD